MGEKKRDQVGPAQVKTVRCLSCGATYAKPSRGGTVGANPGCPECEYVGWVLAPDSQDSSLPVPPWIARGAGRRDGADAAEVVVPVRPGANLESGRLQGAGGFGAEPGLEMDERRDGVEARAIDRGLEIEALVEDASDDLEERAP